MTAPEHAALTARMNRAFDLVSPASKGLNWKDSINTVLSETEITRAGVTLADVVDSVLFFTGTPAKATLKPGLPDGSGKPAPLYHVTAPGYWAGPCN